MWLKLCGAAVLCAVAVVLLKSAKGAATALQWTAILAFTGATLALWQPLVSWVNELCVSQGVGEMSALMFKGLGVAVLTQLCAELCRQSGESALATGVEGAGRAELLLLCLPLLRELLQTAQNLLDTV